MQPLLAAHFLPNLVPPDELAGGTVVVIDVLRASTVISHALAAGARAVIPALEIDEARRIAAGLPSGEALLGGEREGLPIAGFDLGNSPSEYTAKAVGGRTVVFTTTNGTRAMNRCRAAGRVLVGAFVNLSAVCETIKSDAPIGNPGDPELLWLYAPHPLPPIHLLCAGTRGRITREDVLFAGAVIDRLLTDGAVDETAQNDQARIARAAWREATGGESPISMKKLAAELRNTQGGRNLKAIHLERDIDDVAQLDLLRVVPELNVAAWRIEPAKRD